MKVRHEQYGEILLPDFLIVGAPKSATTSLYFYLNEHPQIRMSSIKESWFFSFLGNPPNYTSPGVLSNVVSRVDDYSALFSGATGEQLLGDASPSYLYTYRDSIRNIRSVYPPDKLDKLKIIISLRDPVGRAFSQYKTFRRVDQEPLSFEEAIDRKTIELRLHSNWNIFYDYIGFGEYFEQVNAYLDAFGRERVHIILYDEVQSDIGGVCRSVFEFIGVDSEFVPNTATKYNAVGGEPKRKWLVRLVRSQNPVKRFFSAGVKKILIRLPREATMKAIESLFGSMFRPIAIDEDTRKELTGAYSDEVAQVEKLIGRDLSKWKQGA